MYKKKITADEAKVLAEVGATVWWQAKGIRGMNRFYAFFLESTCPVLRKKEGLTFYVEVE